VTLEVKKKNTREVIQNRTVQKTISMSDMILEFFFIALNSKMEWTLQPTEITNKRMEKYNQYLQATRPPQDYIAHRQGRASIVTVFIL